MATTPVRPLALLALTVVACGVPAPPRAAPAPTPAHARATLPAVPLHTGGRSILDANGKRFKLASVSWYGAEERDHVVAGLERARLGDLAHLVRTLGFNSVRIPWSNELVELDPVVGADRVAANPELAGRHALEILDAVIQALAGEGLVVILDNHTSTADWCCSWDDGNGLWYRDGYPESSWIADWRTLASRYRDQPAVVAADLRNEPRESRGLVPTWGGPPETDWHGAATRAGNAILGVRPDLLIVVEGLAYSADLTGVARLPIELTVRDRVVYSPHDYAWFHPGLTSLDELRTDLGRRWGYILVQGQPYTAPLWIGEFGTCHTSPACVDATSGEGLWFAAFRTYLAEGDVDWAYWALNGTQARGTTRTFGAEETYGVLDRTWSAPALPALLDALDRLAPATYRP